MSNNEVKDFIVKIRKNYDKYDSIKKLFNINELVECLTELDNLIEMYEVKSAMIYNIQMLIVMRMKNTNSNCDKHMLHTIFYGVPGAGKTRTAKILSKIWNALGILKYNKLILNNDDILEKINSIRSSYINLYGKYHKPDYKDCKSMLKVNETLWDTILKDLHETGESLSNKIISKIENGNYMILAGREDLVAEYTGQTAVKTQNFLLSCLGKCVIIDEAYLLYTGSTDTFGYEALTTLNKFMDEHSNEIIIIFTGYEDKLRETIFKVQPGLERRFQWVFNMKGYTPLGLYNIFIKQLKDDGWIVKDEILIKNFFEENYQSFKNFGGDTANLADKCKMVYSEYYMNLITDSLTNLEEDKFINIEILLKAYELYFKNKL